MAKQTIVFPNAPSILETASIVGKKEGEGPLGGYFDKVVDNALYGADSWESAESKFMNETLKALLAKANKKAEDVGAIFAGDLLDQCCGATFGVRGLEIPFLGLYGACSTMALSLICAALAVSGGFLETAIAATGSHFCSAEKQFRFPLEYGGQRPPTAQWTATGAGAALVGAAKAGKPKITAATPGKIVDLGVTDANNMGAAMAPAAADTIAAHLRDTGKTPADFDLILTGDLGQVGSGVLLDLLKAKGYDLSGKHGDCGLLLFDAERQDVHSGGSGCGCSAAVLCGYMYRRLCEKKLRRVLFAATGALMSPTSVQQGESIPGIAHAVVLEL
jgi:stage V sporulation protein AD